jgi:outer membrane protein
MIALVAVVAAARVVTLEQAVQSAREHQPQLRQARAVTQAASARERAALAPMLPQLNAQAGYQRTTANPIARPGAASVQARLCPTAADPLATCSEWSTYNSWSDNVTASLLLWDFGVALNRYQAAGAQAQAQEAQERATALQVDLTARAAYFDARANKSLVQVAQDTLANQQKHLEQTEGFVKAGTHPEIDLAQARTDTANARVQLINAENNYETSKVALNSAMGILGPTDYDVADEAMPPVAGEDSEVGPLLEEATGARPEIASIEALVRADQLTVRSIEGDYWPSIGATAGVTQGGTSPAHLGWNASAGISLTWNIYGGGVTRANVAEAEANVANEVAQLDLLKQQLRTDVEAARLAVRAAKASISAAQEALVNARERLRLAEQRYQVGVGSAIELSDAQVALTQSSSQVVQADDRLSTARAQLIRAVGRK